MRVALALVVGVIVGFWLDDPADRVVTETTTETVEVAGPEVVRYERPALPDSCLTYIDLMLDQREHVNDYSAAVAGQGDIFNDALKAIMDRDTNLINEQITRQGDVTSAGMGPLRALINEAGQAKDYHELCAAEMEELR